MSKLTMIGVDLAKNWFQIHGTDEKGKKLFNRKISRTQMMPFFATVSRSMVVMEACGSSSYWSRQVSSQGHEVRRIHPRYVAQFRGRSKSDALDAAAICLAARQQDIPFVHTKTQEQSDIQALHRVRERHIQARTASANQIRGLLSEDGLISKGHLSCPLSGAGFAQRLGKRPQPAEARAGSRRIQPPALS